MSSRRGNKAQDRNEDDDSPRPYSYLTKPPRTQRSASPNKNARSSSAIGRRNPEVWKKILEAQQNHQLFLDKLGFAETRVGRGRFIDPREVYASPKGLAGPYSEAFETTLTGKGIPWRTKDIISSNDRRKAFESVSHRHGVESPEPQENHHPHPHHHLQSPSSKEQKKLTSLNQVLTITIDEAILKASQHSSSPTKHPHAKVDTGLQKLRQAKARPDHPPVNLTPAPKLPGYVSHPQSIIPDSILGSRHNSDHNIETANPFGNPNDYDNYEQFKNSRAEKIRAMTERLYPNGAGGLHNPTGGSQRYGPSMNIQEVLRLKFNNSYDKQGVSFTEANLNNQYKFESSHILNNNIQVLRAPRHLYTPESTQQMIIDSNGSAGQKLSQLVGRSLRPTGPSGPMGQHVSKPMQSSPKDIMLRKYRPSQLLPKHVPGPKYDNIYIGTYSGSDSDRDSDQVKSKERKVKYNYRSRILD